MKQHSSSSAAERPHLLMDLLRVSISGAARWWQVLARHSVAATFGALSSWWQCLDQRPPWGSGRLGSDALFVLCIWRFISRHYSGFQCSLRVPCCTAWTIFTLCDLLLVSNCGLEWITLEVLQKYVFGWSLTDSVKVLSTLSETLNGSKSSYRTLVAAKLFQQLTCPGWIPASSVEAAEID